MARRRRIQPLDLSEGRGEAATDVRPRPPAGDGHDGRAVVALLEKTPTAEQVLQEMRNGKWVPVLAVEDDIRIVDNGVLVFIPRGEKRLVPERVMGYVLMQEYGRKAAEEALRSGPLVSGQFWDAPCALCRRPARLCSCVVR